MYRNASRFSISFPSIRFELPGAPVDGTRKAPRAAGGGAGNPAGRGPALYSCTCTSVGERWRRLSQTYTLINIPPKK
eukprot:1378478-Prymnesium_polylepis.2